MFLVSLRLFLSFCLSLSLSVCPSLIRTCVLKRVHCVGRLCQTGLPAFSATQSMEPTMKAIDSEPCGWSSREPVGMFPSWHSKTQGMFSVLSRSCCSSRANRFGQRSIVPSPLQNDVLCRCSDSLSDCPFAQAHIWLDFGIPRLRHFVQSELSAETRMGVLEGKKHERMCRHDGCDGAIQNSCRVETGDSVQVSLQMLVRFLAALAIRGLERVSKNNLRVVTAPFC